MYAPQSGDPAENPAHTIERDLADEKIDLAILWGPMAGFLVAQARRLSGMASGAVRAGSRDQVRLRDLDGRALRREGMERHARPVDRQPRARACAGFSQASSCRWSTPRARSLRTSARPSVCAPMACPSAFPCRSNSNGRTLSARESNHEDPGRSRLCRRQTARSRHRRARRTARRRSAGRDQGERRVPHR